MHTFFQAAASNGNRAAVRKLENSQRLRQEIAARRDSLRALPEIVTFHNTDICNLRCVMCPRHLGQGKHALGDDLLKLVADELLPTALKANLTTGGGEPLGVGFETLLECARRHDTRIDVTTNGLLMTREKFLAMQPALDHLNVSVDCVVPEIYERIRVGASFEQLRARLARMVELRKERPDGMLLSISAVVMASTLPHLASLVRFAADHGADGVVLQRLQHDVMPVPDEEIAGRFSPAEIEQLLDDAEQAARGLGINMVSSGFGRPPLWVKPMRDKVPNPLDGTGVCSFLAQTFTLMFTGEVYPCCKPTDYRLGDVRRESAHDIWNGERLRSLRRAHYQRSGTLFCSGCEHAPHLAPRRFARLQGTFQGARRWLDNRRTARLSAADRSGRAQVPPPPPHRDVPHVVDALRCDVEVVPLQGAREASALDERDQSLWFLRGGMLHRAHDARAVGKPVALVDAARRRGCLLAFVRPGVLLASFEASGAVVRIETEDVAANGVGAVDSGCKVRTVCRLSDERASVRTSGLAVAEDGAVWIGEYGVAPGLRCAIVHRSRDGGETFVQVGELPPARHVHAVAISHTNGCAIVTTGDVGMERATYTCGLEGIRWQLWLAPWSGFTAIAEVAGRVHLGTDLAVGNGLVRALVPGRSTGPLPEYRRLPRELDLQVRQIEVLQDGRLLVLLSMDEDLVESRRDKRAVLLLSSDQGASWSVVHRFAPNWANAPEAFVVVGEQPLACVTDGLDGPQLLVVDFERAPCFAI